MQLVKCIGDLLKCET